MTPAEIALVQRSFGQVALDKERVAARFYERLFVLDPSLRTLFKGDMVVLGQKLMSTIATAVSHLKQPQAVAPTVQRLGQKHRGFGVKEAHYGLVGQALVWALEQQLGASFTPDVKAAWTAMYGDIASAMKRAA